MEFIDFCIVMWLSNVYNTEEETIIKQKYIQKLTKIINLRF